MAYYVKYKKWWDTQRFNQVGHFWVQDNKYCPFPRGTHAYDEFWDEQIHYIENGFVHEGQRIAGLHYLYSNFCLIKDKKKRTVTIPDFWALDAEYFLELEKVLALGPWRDEETGEAKDPFRPVVWECSKSRQVGASLKNCVPLLYNMCFVPFSQNYIGAYLSDDTAKTCQMFLDYFYHCQEFCEFGKRFIVQTKYEHYKVGYQDFIDGDKKPSGYQSELHVITWKDNPEKGVGGSCDLFLVEEAGLHPTLLTSLGFISPACKDGDYTTGNILVYGAAGKDGQCNDLDKLHHNPKSYDAWAYPNIWEPDSFYKETGFFVPNYSCRKGHMDKDGNPNQETAIQALKNSLVNLEKTDYEKYLLRVSQFPNKPSEMFGNKGQKRFNTKLITKQIAYLLANHVTGSAVELFTSEAGNVRWSYMDENIARPIRIYPVTPDIDLEGCPEIFEFPDADPEEGLYIASIDSYNQDQAFWTTSLGSIIIYKKVNNIGSEGTHRVVVAEYTGRPIHGGKQKFYEICVMLLKMYNAIAMPENEDSELVPWFITNGYDDLLADQPDIIRGYIKGSMVKRLKGIHATEALILAAENKIARYINEDLGDELDEDGNVVGKRHGVNRILSLGLLYELLNYVHDNNKNFDRVRTFGWLLLYEEETHMEQRKPVSDKTKKFLTDTKRFGKRPPITMPI
jgi:hypothetical protein